MNLTMQEENFKLLKTIKYYNGEFFLSNSVSVNIVDISGHCKFKILMYLW
jgi:hypothetical protein